MFIADKNIFRTIKFSLLVKAVYILFAFACSTFTDKFVIAHSAEGVTEIFKRNDSGWYEGIAMRGYPQVSTSELGYHNAGRYQQSAWAFFPLYPALIGLIERISPLSFNAIAFIFSLLFSTLGFILFYIFCKSFFTDKEKAFTATLLLIILPFHYFFSMMYTEALYFFLLMLCFISIEKKRWVLLSVAFALLSIVRANGLFMILPLAIFLLEKSNVVEGIRMKFENINSKVLYSCLCFLSGILIFVAYCFYQKRMTGTYFAFTAAQAGWYKESMFPLLAFFRRGDWETQVNSVYTILFFLIAIFALKKLPLSFNVLVFISLLLPLCGGSTMSMPRYISVIFPFTILFAERIYGMKQKKILIGSLFILQLFTFYFWLIRDSFSY